ncbi:MAG TPA: LexA family transcriptional regulator [Candidatus Acidoferrales bacterium]
MSFLNLQENLRQELRRRVAAGELTGAELARRLGLTQAHISNFLHGKRGLKLSTLDRAVAVMALDFYSLLPAEELAGYAPAVSRAEAETAEVPLIRPAAATTPVITRMLAHGTLRLAAILSGVRTTADGHPSRKGWTRFVALEVADNDTSMAPRVPPGACVIVDRHRLAPGDPRFDRGRFYAVKNAGGVQIRYLERQGDRLLLRPHHPRQPSEIWPWQGTVTEARIVGLVVALVVICR